MNQIISQRDFGNADRPSVHGALKAFPTHKAAQAAGEWFRKAANEGINTAGGVLVPSEIVDAVVRLRETYGTARRNAQIVSMASDLANVPRRVSDFTASWATEGGAITASQAVLSNVGLTAKKLGVLTTASIELEEDAISFAEWVATEFAYGLAKAEDEACFFGDGSATYGGMTGLRTLFNAGVGSLAGAVDAASGHDTMLEIDATDLASLIARLPSYAQPGARWYCSPVMFGLVFARLASASGGLLSRNVNGRNEILFAGYPVEITPAMLSPATATTDTSDVAMILFGDLSLSVMLGDTREFTFARATAPKFVEGQIQYKGTERVDIVCHGCGDATTPGPIVALMGE